MTAIINKQVPFFTVCITAYNYSQYIEEAIKSVVEQTYPYWKLVIVDDGSTDNTQEVVEPYLKNEKIEYIRQRNRGLPSARNTGIMNAKGHFMVFLDADDHIAAEYLESIVEEIEHHPHADVIYTDLQHYGNRTDTIRLNASISKETFRAFNPIAYCAAIRLPLLQEIGGYNPKFKLGWEDYSCWIELFLSGASFYHIPLPLFFYHKHGSSMIDTSFKPEAVEFSNKLLHDQYPELYD